MARGEHVYVLQRYRGIPYQHHGIDMGDGTVVHLAPAAGQRLALFPGSGSFSVRRESLKTFSGGKPFKVIKHDKPLPADEVVARAAQLVGSGDYDLLENNCEHFATLCATGEANSRQVEFSQSGMVAVTSALTKGVWAISGRVAARYATKVVSKPHPLSLLADGAEAVATLSGCAVGMSAERTRKLAKASGEVTAIAVGCVVGGPVGGAVSLALHRSSTTVAEHVCTAVRRGLCALKESQEEQPPKPIEAPAS
jgi:hypothetical protein